MRRDFTYVDDIVEGVVARACAARPPRDATARRTRSTTSATTRRSRSKRSSRRSSGSWGGRRSRNTRRCSPATCPRPIASIERLRCGHRLRAAHAARRRSRAVRRVVSRLLRRRPAWRQAVTDSHRTAHARASQRPAALPRSTLQPNLMILVTGGAGFIGANFVLDWLAARDEPVVNLDKLTYAGNLGNLAPLAGDRAPRLRARRHRRSRAASTRCSRAPAARDRPLRRRDARRPLDRRARARSSTTNVVGTFALLEAARAYWSALPPAERAAFRFLHVSTDEVYGSLGPTIRPFTETTPYAPNCPYSASKAASDHLVRAYHHTYGLPVLITNCSNNYGPLPVSREADPADDPQRARGQAAAGLRRRPERPRLAVRRGPLRGDPRGARARAGPARPTTSAATARRTNLDVVADDLPHRSTSCARAGDARAR